MEINSLFDDGGDKLEKILVMAINTTFVCLKM